MRMADENGVDVLQKIKAGSVDLIIDGMGMGRLRDEDRT
jgi:hypothetical protein